MASTPVSYGIPLEMTVTIEPPTGAVSDRTVVQCAEILLHTHVDLMRVAIHLGVGHLCFCSNLILQARDWPYHSQIFLFWPGANPWPRMSRPTELAQRVLFPQKSNH